MEWRICFHPAGVFGAPCVCEPCEPGLGAGGRPDIDACGPGLVGVVRRDERFRSGPGTPVPPGAAIPAKWTVCTIAPSSSFSIGAPPPKPFGQRGASKRVGLFLQIQSPGRCRASRPGDVLDLRRGRTTGQGEGGGVQGGGPQDLAGAGRSRRSRHGMSWLYVSGDDSEMTPGPVVADVVRAEAASWLPLVS